MVVVSGTPRRVASAVARATATPVGGLPWARNGGAAGTARRSVPVGARSATTAAEALAGAGAVEGEVAPVCDDELFPHAAPRTPSTTTRTRAMVGLRMAVVLSCEAAF